MYYILILKPPSSGIYRMLAKCRSHISSRVAGPLNTLGWDNMNNEKRGLIVFILSFGWRQITLHTLNPKPFLHEEEFH